MSEGHDDPGYQPGLAERASSTVQDATATAQEKAGELTQRGQQRLALQLDDRSTKAGTQARSLAEALRRSSEQLQEDSTGGGGAARVAEQAAEQVERIGLYLERKSGDEMLHDVEDFSRRRPWLVAGVGVAAGLAASRFLKASSERRYGTRRSDARGARAEPLPAGTGSTAHRAESASVAGGTDDGFDTPTVAPLSRESRGWE